MKKTVMSLIIIFIVLFCTVKSFASETMSVQGNTTLKTEEKTVELTILLGDISSFIEGEPLGFQGTLTYDENMFQNVLVEGLNGWTINYEETTKTFMGETDVASADTQIAKVILTVKDGVEAGTSGTVNFSNILLTDGVNDYTFNNEVVVTMEEEQVPPTDEEDPEEQEPGEEDPVNNTVNNNVPENNTNKVSNTTTIQGNTPDKTTGTTATTSLPKAGLRNILAILVVISVISMIVFKIKSRDIKY